jgi:hypothetical protein
MRVLLICFFLSLLCTGCDTLGYDHREDIAKATLYSSRGGLDEKALSGALLKKFSDANYPPAALASFVESLGGKCYSGMAGSMSCSIPQSSSFCIDSRIDIEAVVIDGEISALRVKEKFHGC